MSSDLAAFKGWQKYVDALLALLKARTAAGPASTVAVVAQGTNGALVNFGGDNLVHPVANTGAVVFPASGKAIVWASIPYNIDSDGNSGTTMTFVLLNDGVAFDTVPIVQEVTFGTIAPDQKIYTREVLLATTAGAHTISATIRQAAASPGITTGTISAGLAKVGVLTVP